ncbi:hypothetical protein CC86DRAFT_51937 [Ophiobolus disseminans]|uniref:Uncharacterized protein n=1 Tax=Ophiobolus disseminans TaxID=1469910 RepID=A0A6A6ZT22_9PLEO|nr:hypothetical protein CC86DRAFT_51937 [Ophiobolus disseminans]
MVRPTTILSLSHHGHHLQSLSAYHAFGTQTRCPCQFQATPLEDHLQRPVPHTQKSLQPQMYILHAQGIARKQKPVLGDLLPGSAKRQILCRLGLTVIPVPQHR